MHPIFNISSAGHTATNWMNNILNSHPNIVCFHALRADPFVHFDDMKNYKNWLDVNSMVRGLLKMHSYSLKKKTVGICHVFYGSDDVKKAFRSHEGGFAVVFRNIFQRMHSALCHHSSRIFSERMAGENLYDEIKKKYTEKSISIERVMTWNEFNPADALFFELLQQFLFYDQDNFKHASQEEIIIFEKAVSDASYLVKCFENLLGEEMSLLQPVINENMSRPTNVHSQGIKNTDAEWFQIWPESFRLLFFRCIMNIGKDKFFKAYEGLGYTMPSVVLEYFQDMSSKIEIPS